MNTTAAVQSKIKRLPRATAFPVGTFSALGSPQTVRKALSELTEQGELVRVARGVYARPKTNRFAGINLPANQEIARVIARRTGEQLAPHGAELARRFGLTTQTPVQASFYTTGRTRRIPTTRGYIYFQHAPEHLVKLASSPAGEAALALHYLGKTHATKDNAAQLLNLLPPEERQRLNQTEHLPTWMKSLLNSAKHSSHAH